MRAPTTTADALVDYLADRRVLIVLDNCEHVLDAAADLVDAIAAAAADVHVLVTSREPLGLDGEQVRRVQSLALPAAEAAPADAEAAAAVRLFAERAAAVSDGFTIDAGNVAAVVEICRHLDGIPLAIELAAARVRAMAPAEIARRLDERFRLLAGGSRRSQERHRTLLATVSWSHDLLTDDERVTFRRLAVFPASFDLAAAEAVAGDGDVDVVDCVLRLVDRSLVVYEPDARPLPAVGDVAPVRRRPSRRRGRDRTRPANATPATSSPSPSALRPSSRRAIRPPACGDSSSRSTTCARPPTGASRRSGGSSWPGMCRQLWYFLSQAAPVDGAVWYQQVVDHAAALDDQIVVDTLGEYAWLQVANLADFAASVELAERSRTLADSKHLVVSQWASNASGMAALYTGRYADALRAVELGVAEAEARGDELGAVNALCVQIGALNALEQRERGAHVGAEALRRADRTGHPVYVSASVICVSSAHLWSSTEPDFAATRDILDRHEVELIAGDLTGVWYELFWGATLLGLDEPGAVERLVRAARGADQLNTRHVLDLALRQLAIAAAQAGLMRQAALLVSYSDAVLRSHRIAQPGEVWVQARVDAALADVPRDEPEPLPHRGEMMAVVAEIEALLTRDESRSQAMEAT